MPMEYLLCFLMVSILCTTSSKAGVAVDRWSDVTVERRSADEDSCPPIPHDCDPKCIKYDVPHCRKCECEMSPGSNSGGGPFSMSGPNSSPFDLGVMGSGSGGGGGSPFDMSGGSGTKSGPFDRGQNLYQTPYSSSMMSIGTGPSVFQPISRLGIQGAPTMNWPGIFMRPGALQGQHICIKGQLVCPKYCLVTDEYGCKTCPCGPANGMLPSVVGGTHIVSRPQISTTKSPQTQKSNDQCLATYVCMLSCKDGYKLGPKGSNGCQTCECTKNKGGSSNVNGNGTGTGNNTNGHSNGGQSNGQSNGQSGSGQSNGQNQGQSGSGAGQYGNSQGNGQTTNSLGEGNGFEMMGLSTGSAGGGEGSKNKFNPFFAGSLMVGSSGSGGGGGMGGGGMGSGSSGGGGGGGCVGPFCAGAGSSGGGGGAGPMLSPFAAASSGAGGPGMGSGGGTNTAAGNSGGGSQGPFGMSGNSGTALIPGNSGTGLISGNSGTGVMSGSSGTGLISGNSGTGLVSGNSGTGLISGNSGTGFIQGNGHTLTSNTGSKEQNIAIASIPGMNCIGPECSAKNGKGHAITSNSGSKQQAVIIASTGNTMTPNTGSKQQAVTLASIPGMDCIGPECSAKNGHEVSKDGLAQLFETAGLSDSKHTKYERHGNLKESLTQLFEAAGLTSSKYTDYERQNLMSQIMGLVHQKTDIHPPSCPATELCKRTCKYTVKLGNVGTDGCPACSCVMNEPQQKICDAVIKCMKTCNMGYVISSSKDNDGCPACTCKHVQFTAVSLPTRLPTRAPQPSVSNVDICTQKLSSCARSCKYGYHMQPQTGDRCPECTCLSAPNPTAAPLPPTNVHTVLQNCPEAVHCMTHCHDKGYTLETVEGQSCPVCKCNKDAIQLVQCNGKLTCPYGCTVGYKCDASGCPTCHCVTATEIGIQKIRPTFFQSAIVCSSQFSCIQKCELGYQSGSNGCPTCTCLKMGAVASNNAHVFHSGGSSSGIKPTVPSSNIGTESKHPCTSGSCHTGSTHQLTMREMCPETYNCLVSCPYSYSLHTQQGAICPSCICAQTLQTNNIGVNQGTLTHTGQGNGGMVTVVNNQNHTGNEHLITDNLIGSNPGMLTVNNNCVGPTCPQNHSLLTGSTETNTLQKTCPEVYVCIKQCPNGYQLTGQNGKLCPQCLCVKIIDGNTTETSIKGGNSHESNNGVLISSGVNHSSVGHVNQINNQNHLSPGNSGHSSSVSGGSMGTIYFGGGSTFGGNVNPVGNGNTHNSYQIGGGHGFENCLGPECSAKNGLQIVHHGKVDKKPLSPSQCADIIHCVMTCHHGYKVGKVEADGCPTCECLNKT